MTRRTNPSRYGGGVAFMLVCLFVFFACGAPPLPGVAGEPSNQPTLVILPTATPVSLEPAPAQTDIPASTATPAILEPVPLPTEIHIPPAIPESRRLTLEYPSRMKAGVEGDIIRLTLEVDDLGGVIPTSIKEGNVVAGEIIEVPNLYDTHDVTAEARLDLAGMVVQPSDSTLEPLKPGQSVTFFWSIHPQQAGIYRGTVWLHLNFVERASGESSRIAVSAQFIEIEAVDFFGLPVSVARTSGVIGSVIGGIIGFPFMEDILKFIFRRRKH